MRGRSECAGGWVLMEPNFNKVTIERSGQYKPCQHCWHTCEGRESGTICSKVVKTLGNCLRPAYAYLKPRPLVTFLASWDFFWFLFSRDSIITDLELSIPYRDIQILLINWDFSRCISKVASDSVSSNTQGSMEDWSWVDKTHDQIPY